MTCTTTKELRRMSKLIIEALNELKKEMNERFDKVEEKLEQMEDNLKVIISSSKK